MKERAITIKTKDIYFDVDASSHIRGKGVDNGQNDKVVDAVRTDTGAAMDRAYVQRKLEESIMQMRAIMRDYTKDVIVISFGGYTDELGKNSALEAEDYRLRLTVPDGCKDVNIEASVLLIHKWLVAAILADWFGDLGIDAGNYIQQMSLLASQIRELYVYRDLPKMTK